MTLKRSADRKVTNLATKGAAVKIKNAFGIPAGLSCPGMTAVCELVCYARRTEKQYKGVDANMQHNWSLLRDANMTTMLVLLTEMIQEFRAECEKHNAPKVFRIHWDGDFFSEQYARAWHGVIDTFDDVQFWAYTRSFVPALNVIPILAGMENLALYLSVDSENKKHVSEIVTQFPTVKIATLTDTVADGAIVMQELRATAKPGAACPENTKKIPLITPDGGACVTCGLCVFAKADVRFARLKK